MDLLKKNIDFLRAFRVLSEKQSLLLLKSITDQQAQILGDIAANILGKVLHISSNNKAELLKHKTFIRCIGTGKTSRRKRVICIKKHSKGALALIRVTADKIVRLVDSK